MLTTSSVTPAYRPAFVNDIHWGKNMTAWLDGSSKPFGEQRCVSSIFWVKRLEVDSRPVVHRSRTSHSTAEVHDFGGVAVLSS